MQLTEEKIRKIIKEELGIALEVSEISKMIDFSHEYLQIYVILQVVV